MPYYTDDTGQKQHNSVKILTDGSLLPDRVGGLPDLLKEKLLSQTGFINLPPKLQNQVALLELLKETCRIEKKLHIDKAIVLPEELGGAGIKILPPGEWYQQKGRGKGDKETRKAAIRPERVDYMCEIPGLIRYLSPDVLTRVNYGKNYGTGTPSRFSDYWIFLFPKGAVAENAVAENAVYEFPFKTAIPEEVIKACQTGNEKPLWEFINGIGFLKEIGTTQKIDLIKKGQRYGQHPRADSKGNKMEIWREELKEYIIKNYT
jgi:hypothetical protein